MSKNVPYQNCITFDVQFASKDLAGQQDLTVTWHPLCQTAVPVGTASIVVATTSMTLSPSTGPVSGGYLVTMSIRGVPSMTGTTVFFGNAIATVSSQTVFGSTLVLSVVCPCLYKCFFV